MTILTETITLLTFFVAFLCDRMEIMLDSLFLFIFIISAFAVSIGMKMIFNKAKEQFLTKIDIFNYKLEYDALLMMNKLHELIETSQVNERDEFLLRGFIERHIEICDFPECNCIEYYKVINSTYRIQLATIATMKEDETKQKSMQTLTKVTQEDETVT